MLKHSNPNMAILHHTITLLLANNIILFLFITNKLISDKKATP